MNEDKRIKGLVLSRNIGESIMIGDDIEIIYHAQRGRQIDINIRAPEHVKIVRKEIYGKQS